MNYVHMYSVLLLTDVFTPVKSQFKETNYVHMYSVLLLTAV